MIRAEDLTKHYDGHQALEGLDLTVRPGEVLALFGGNGAGKSTTLNLFLGFIPPTRGRALIAELDVARQPAEARRHLAYVAENVLLYGHATPRENLQYFAALAGKRLSRAQAHAALEAAGLPGDAFERPLRFCSKGMRQKCGLAIAFAKDAHALLLDEPFSGLDPQAAAELAETIARLRAEGRAILMSTHDLLRARTLADAVGIMRRGKLVHHLTREQLLGQDLERLYLDAQAGQEA